MISCVHASECRGFPLRVPYKDEYVLGLDISSFNGSVTAELPIPESSAVAQDGVIALAQLK